MKLNRQEMIAYATVALCEIRKINSILDDVIMKLESEERANRQLNEILTRTRSSVD